MKIKVGIVTLLGYNNYGNRLQNYALVTLLKQLGVDSKSGLSVVSREDLLRCSKENNNKFLYWIKKLIPWKIYKMILQNRYKKDENSVDKLTKIRIKKFKCFTESYTETFPVLFVKNDKEIRDKIHESEYQYFIAGSDQVWNPQYAGNDYEFLTFTSQNKRLSFAASIGVSNIPSRQKERYTKRLTEMRYISVREENAAKIVKELIGKEPRITLDPTLLLEKEEWEKIEKKPMFSIPNEYIVTYFLGKKPSAIEKFVKEKELPLLCLNDKQNTDLYTLDPAEFIYLLNHSKYVLTDSFHAVAFSIIFEKNFFVFERKQEGVEDMFARIYSITNKFHLQERIMPRNEIKDISDIEKDTWNGIRDQLAIEKSKQMTQLKNFFFEQAN